MTIVEDFAVSSRINYACIAPSQSKFVLLDLSIAINLSLNVKRRYIFYVRVKKVPVGQITKRLVTRDTDASYFYYHCCYQSTSQSFVSLTLFLD